ncbi:MAG TPA: hypothetical protein VGE52_15600, partial [Pirellulales bacterium]
AQPPEGASPAKTAGTTNLEAESEGTGAAEPTAAERYASVRRLLEADRARLVELQAEAKKLETEFETASAEFSRLDGELQAARVKVTAATNAADREAAAAQVAALEGDWTPSRDAFDIVIQHRKAIAKQIETLTDKIRLEESFLQQMSTADENAAKPAGMEGTAALPGVGTSPAPEGSPAPTASGAATGMVAPTAPAVTNPPSAQNGTPAPSGATPPAAAPAVPSLIPGIPGLPVPAQTAGTSAAPSATSAGAAPVGTAEAALLTAPISDTAPNEELIAARREAQAKESALQLARRRVEGLNQAIEVFERDQNATQDVFEAAQRELEVAKSAEIAIIERMKDASEKGVAAEELVKLEERRRQVEQRLDEARREVELQTARLVESSDAVKHLKTLRTAAIEKVAEAEKAVAPARSRVWYLESPITPTRLWNWAIDVGPKLIGIVVLMTALWYLARLVASRQVMSFVLRGRRGSTDERESRANTLRLVFENSVGVAILLIGALAILDQLGVNVTVLLGGAAVLGAAIAFGSQNLIKDFFSGFMI